MTFDVAVAAPLIVLGIGLVIGGLLAWLSIRRSTRPAETVADEQLRRRDLEALKDELYSELRAAENVDSADREQLELRAAQTLRELAELAPAPIASGNTAGPAPVTAGARYPMLAGAALGGGMVALVALLVVWAQRDATPDPQQPMAPTAAAQGEAAAPGQGMQAPLPPMVAQRLEALRARVAENPNDVPARRELLQLLVAHEQFFDAFGVAQASLEADPDDPEAYYVLGLVRYMMGQPEEALGRLATAVEKDPQHVQSWLVRGLIQLQLGDRETAIASWQQGLQAAGGNEPRLEQLLEQASNGMTTEEIFASSPPG